MAHLRSYFGLHYSFFMHCQGMTPTTVHKNNEWFIQCFYEEKVILQRIDVHLYKNQWQRRNTGWAWTLLWGFRIFPREAWWHSPMVHCFCFSYFIKSRTDGQRSFQRFCLHFAFRWWVYKMSNRTLLLKWETVSGGTHQQILTGFWKESSCCVITNAFMFSKVLQSTVAL